MLSPSLRAISIGAWLTVIAGAPAQEDPFAPAAAPEQAVPEAAESEGEYVEPVRQVRVQVEFIEVSHETLTQLLLKPRPGGDDSGLRQDLAKLAEEGKASVVETLLCNSRSGEKSTAESIKEYIYPTEWEPAELPNEIYTTEAGDKVKLDGRDVATGPTPTSFETRNLGSTLEIEPTIGNSGKFIDLRFTPEIVYHAGDETWSEWKDKRGDASIRMPAIYTLRLQSAATLADGQPLLVAALSPKGENGFPDFKRKLMVFVRCDVRTLGR